MTVQTHGGLMVIGCGDFGAAAVNHLQERGVESASVGGRRVALVTLTGKAATRQQAASMFEAATQGGWEELEEALRLCGSQPLIALIGAADDTAGGGLLVSALRYLTEGKHGRTAVWLAMPDGVRRYQARAYATLTELEVLRKSGALERCFLREIASGSVAYAGMFGEAAVAYAQGQRGAGTDAGLGLGAGLYAGFGLGAVRDVAGLMAQQAAVLAAKAIVQQRAASREYQPAGFAGALMSAADELLREEFPDTWVEQRWIEVHGRNLARHCRNEEFTGDSLIALLQRELQSQDQFYRDSYWRTGIASRMRALKQNLLAKIRELRGTCGNESEAACQELLAALVDLRGAINRAIISHLKSSHTRIHEYDFLRGQMPEQFARLRARTPLFRSNNTELREQAVQGFEDIDLMGCGYVIDAVRLDQLKMALIDLDSEETALASSVNAVRKRADTDAKLLEEIAVWTDEAVPVTQGIHLFPSVAGAESARRLAEVIEGASLVAAMNHGSAQSPSARAAALKNAALIQARAALDRMPELLPPRGEAARERWLTAVKPSLALADPSPQGHKQPARTYRISDNVPADIKAELVQQLDGVPASSSTKWFQGDGLVYCETDGVELACLNALPDLHGAYSTQLGQQQGLHVLPEPADGWPSLLPEARVPRKQLEAAAATVVRACLLGLIGAVAESMLTARYLQEDRQAIQSVSWLNLGEAVRSLAQHKPLLDGLGSQAQRWFSRLDESQVAGYHALLSGFQHSPAVTRLKGDEAAVVAKAIAAELEEAVRTLRDRGDGWEPRARAMAEQVGGSEDSFSLAAGEWRYLKW